MEPAWREKNGRKKRVRKRVQGQGEEGAERKRPSLGAFKNMDCGG